MAEDREVRGNSSYCRIKLSLSVLDVDDLFD